MFVPEESVLHNINGATNAVMIDSSSLQQSVFVGQGAGRYPTASEAVAEQFKQQADARGKGALSEQHLALFADWAWTDARLCQEEILQPLGFDH